MLYLDNLKNLQPHINYLRKVLQKNSIFIVWWSVRDILLWLETNPNDIDITSNWNPNDIYSNILKNDISLFKTDKFWTITIIPKNQKSKVKIQYELTPLRSEWWYDDFRHPWVIDRTNSIIKDSCRRDFTINCMYYFLSDHTLINSDAERLKSNLLISKILNKKWYIFIKDKSLLIVNSHEVIENLFVEWAIDETKITNYLSTPYYLDKNSCNWENLQIILDPWWWINDIIDKKIKSVWEPDNRFQEDALRVIRWIRIPNILNQKLEKLYSKDPLYWKDSIVEYKIFDYDTATWKSMKKNFYLVQFIAKERIKDEIMKVFKSNNPFWFIVLLDELNLLKYLFPSLYLTKWNNQPIRYHALDTYSHTIMTFYHLQFLNKNPLVRFWMLYHDVWKPDQYYFAQIWWIDQEERRKMHWSWLHHPVSWEDHAKKDFKLLWFSSKEFNEIAFYVRYHLLIWEVISANPENIPKKLKKVMWEYWYNKTINLIDICIADRLWQYNPMQSSNILALQNLKKLAKKIYKEQWEFSIKNLDINWSDLIKYFNLVPWPEIWILLKKAFDWVVLDVKSRNKKNLIIKYLK